MFTSVRVGVACLMMLLASGVSHAQFAGPRGEDPRLSEARPQLREQCQVWDDEVLALWQTAQAHSATPVCLRTQDIPGPARTNALERFADLCAGYLIELLRTQMASNPLDNDADLPVDGTKLLQLMDDVMTPLARVHCATGTDH